MSDRTAQSDPPRAACLTPPAAGGVAVIQVVGCRAIEVVQPLLRSRREINLATMKPGELRLCRWVDGDQTIDDALVAVRHTPDGEAVVDISLHGGPRVVQRSLQMLQRAGARIVEAADLLDRSWPAASGLERELLPMMLKARTRAVAVRLARLPERLTEVVRRIEADAHAYEISRARAGLAARPGTYVPGSEDAIARAREELTRFCAHHAQARLLVAGVRVVLVGEPNVGKSMLANALAEREHAIVSDVAGTTRDWVDHPGAIDGAPFTFVDTAGVRRTDDPIEREAVRRTHQQATGADIVLHVLDSSAAPSQDDRDSLAASLAARGAADRSQPNLLVWNKSDLPADPGQAALCDRAGGTGLRISAATGHGLDRLRYALLEAVGLVNWRQGLVAPVTDRQVAMCRDALAALTSAPPDIGTCAACLHRLLVGNPVAP